jgi:hypothetical protein
MTASEIEKALLAAGWHRRKFPAMGVVAMNPHYEDFSLGIAARWLDAGQLSKNLRLWIFPTHDTLLETMEGIT